MVKVTFDIIYLDFSKAFDKVLHKRLIKKLESYGIQGNVLRCISELLEDRKQRMQLNIHRLGWTEVRIGVPQDFYFKTNSFNSFYNFY